MKDLKQFEEFIRTGIIKKQSPDKSRSKFLVMEAEQGYTYLLKLIKTMGIENRNANDYVKNCYDILMELTRAKMLLEGLNASGFKAHESEIAYWWILQFKEQDIRFLDKIRFFRNGMLYYGTILDKEYAEKVIEFTKNNYQKLKAILNK
ncbi:MAG: hypothetical protein AABW49_00615 [Nanoarchaeota archaeon]